MSSEEIKKIIGEYFEKPEYFIKNYPEILEIVSEEEEKLCEADIHRAIQECRFKSPDVIALIALVCPPVVLSVTDRIFGEGKLLGLLYRCTMILWYAMMLATLFSGRLTPNDILLFGACFIVTSVCFRGWTKQWNSWELLYQILKTQEKVP